MIRGIILFRTVYLHVFFIHNIWIGRHGGRRADVKESTGRKIVFLRVAKEQRTRRGSQSGTKHAARMAGWIQIKISLFTLAVAASKRGHAHAHTTTYIHTYTYPNTINGERKETVDEKEGTKRNVLASVQADSVPRQRQLGGGAWRKRRYRRMGREIHPLGCKYPGIPEGIVFNYCLLSGRCCGLVALCPRRIVPPGGLRPAGEKGLILWRARASTRKKPLPLAISFLNRAVARDSFRLLAFTLGSSIKEKKDIGEFSTRTPFPFSRV